MNGRNTNPTDDPIVARLRQAESIDAEDVIALIGFVGQGRNGTFRVFPDLEQQRWLEIPAIIDSQRLDPDDVLSKSIVWVDRPTMMKPIQDLFDQEQTGQLDALLQVPPFSTWNLIPETRLVAASLLGLIAYDDGREYS